MVDKMEIKEQDLKKMELGDKYDDKLATYNTVSWKDYALLYAILIIVFSFLIWANFATVDEVTRGVGKVVPSSKIQLVQNLEGGIIEKILVKQGDSVKKGQKLVNIKNVQADAEYQANLNRAFALKATIAKLKAIVQNTEPQFSEELTLSAPNIVKIEKENYYAYIKQHKNQLEILKQQKEQKKQEIKELEETLNGAIKILSLTKEEHAVIAPLEKKGTVSKIELLQLNSKIAAQQAEVNNTKIRLKKAKSALKEAEERIKSLNSAEVAKIKEEISQKTTELASLTEALLSYQDRANRTEILSPVDGKIKDIKITTIGGVVKPGETIMEIVPSNDNLIIEASISPADIAFIYPEQKAIVKITAYDYETYGGIEATVKEISADTIVNEYRENFYRVTLESDKKAIEYNQEKLPIIAGMTASVDIMTGKKTIMSYIITPFKKALKNSLHER